MSKLYVTAKSEKASKGQGGNRYLDIVVNDDIKRTILQVQLWHENEKLLLKYQDCMGNEVFEDITLKGKSQKGEKCSEPYCNELKAVGGMCLEHYQANI